MEAWEKRGGAGSAPSFATKPPPIPQYKIKTARTWKKPCTFWGGRRHRANLGEGAASTPREEPPSDRTTHHHARRPGSAGDSPHHAYELPAGEPGCKDPSGQLFFLWGGRAGATGACGVGGPRCCPQGHYAPAGKGRKGGGRQEEAGGRRPERASYLAEPGLQVRLEPCTPNPPNPAHLRTALQREAHLRGGGIGPRPTSLPPPM